MPLGNQPIGTTPYGGSLSPYGTGAIGYQILANQDVVFVEDLGKDIDITLPDPTLFKVRGRTLKVVRKSINNHSVTVYGMAGALIDGALTKIMNWDYAVVEFSPTGLEWTISMVGHSNEAGF